LFTIFRWFRRLVYLIILAIFVYLVITSVQVISASTTGNKLPTITGTPVIVVVGGATGAKISDDLAQRCDLAYALYKNHHAHILIVTGEHSTAVAAAYLSKKGIKSVRQVPDGEIPSQLGTVASMLSPAERQDVVMIIDPLQNKWLGNVASTEGLRAQIADAPAPKQSFWQDAQTIWGQSLAVGFGRIFGYGSSGWLGG
jgi:hypothetical protein